MDPEVTALPTDGNVAAGEQANPQAAPATEQSQSAQPEGQEQAAAEGEQSAEQKEAAKKAEKTPEQREIDRLRRRVDNLTKQKYTLAAQLPQGQAQPQQPNPQGSNDEPVTLSRAELQRLIAEQAQQLAPAVKEQQAVMEHRQAVVTKLAKDWGEQEFNAKAMDLDLAVGGLKDAYDRPKPVTDAIFEADDPKALIEYLIDPDNAAEAERLANLPPLQVGRAVARIEAKMELAKKEAKPQPSKAARPIESVKGGGVPTGMPDPKDTKAWIAWSNAQEARR